ncbi:hypothetical protein BDZ89DRAFT_1074803 [Hymenopellis radicata]|nr:hypothetical protein BDZ89DRAFT_1074803 [Hymenopellis radicata]
MSKKPYKEYNELAEIAKDTLKAVESGAFTLPSGAVHDLKPGLARATQLATYYPVESSLSSWKTSPWPPYMYIKEISTLDAAHQMYTECNGARPIGILNFANAVHPGGGFLTGSRAQEESIARSSTLYHTLQTEETKKYYEEHEKTYRSDGGFSSAAMIYSPGVEVFRTHDGGWMQPFPVDVLTCAAVNAFAARAYVKVPKEVLNKRIEDAMRERMGRILFLFEQRGIKDIVLGSFGTGAFGCEIEMVVNIWVELLGRGGRFSRSFDHVIFAILGRPTLDEFTKVYNKGMKRR